MSAIFPLQVFRIHRVAEDYRLIALRNFKLGFLFFSAKHFEHNPSATPAKLDACRKKSPRPATESQAGGCKEERPG